MTLLVSSGDKKILKKINNIVDAEIFSFDIKCFVFEGII